MSTTPYLTVYHRFAAAARRWPDRPFLNVLPETAEIYEIAPGETTYGDALVTVDALVDAYTAEGYGPGVRVGLLLLNRPDFLFHFLALNAVGAGCVPINPDLRKGELSYLVEHSEIALAVAVPERHADLAEASGRLKIIGTTDTIPPSPATTGTPGPETECALLYTSGTTGMPKGCILSNFYFNFTGDWYAEVGGHLALQSDPPDRMLTPLPLFHANALAYSTMAIMAVGGCLTILDRFHPRTWWDSVRAAEATVIHYLGVMPPLWMAEPEGPADRDHQVRFGFGAGIDAKLHAAAEERFGFPLVEGWAMTETGAGGIVMSTHGDRKVGTTCFGRPRGNVEARVVDDDGQEVRRDSPGELQVRHAGPDPRHGFFSGYLKNADATDEAWKGGWLNTGDVVTMDGDGDLHFIDRRKNVIRRSGENISAAEVEAVLGTHPAVHQIAIVAVADDLRDEEVMALVIPSGDADQTVAEAIADFARDQLAYYKAPGWLGFVEDLPVTATAKLQRGAMRALADQALVDGAYDLRHMKKRVA